MGTERNAQKKMKERDGGDRLETARREDEDVEVRGQEEGGEGSSDPGQSGLLKSACVLLRWWAHESVCQHVCFMPSTRCVWSVHVCVWGCVCRLPCTINLDRPASVVPSLPLSLSPCRLKGDSLTRAFVSGSVRLFKSHCAGSCASPAERWEFSPMSLWWKVFETPGLSPAACRNLIGSATSHGPRAKVRLRLILCISRGWPPGVFLFFIFPTVSKVGWQTAEPDLHYRGGCEVCQEKAAHVQQQHIRSDPLICVAPHVQCALLAWMWLCEFACMRATWARSRLCVSFVDFNVTSGNSGGHSTFVRHPGQRTRTWFWLHQERNNFRPSRLSWQFIKTRLL